MSMTFQMPVEVVGVELRGPHDELFVDGANPPPAGTQVTFKGLLGETVNAIVDPSQKSVTGTHLLGSLGFCPARQCWVVTCIYSRAALDRVNFA
jgi:hypothetical protein